MTFFGLIAGFFGKMTPSAGGSFELEVELPERLSRLLSLDTAVGWPDGFRVARDLRNRGYMEEAIYAVLALLKRFSSDPDAQSWGYYQLFYFLLESQGIEAGLPYLDKILGGSVNFAGKSGIVAAAIGHFNATGNVEGVRAILHKLEIACKNNLDRGFSPDDINVNLAIKIGQSVRSLGPDDEISLLRPYVHPGEYLSIFQLQRHHRQFQRPILCNRIPPDIEAYIDKAGWGRPLELYMLENVTALKITARDIVWIDKDGELLTPWQPVPEYIRQFVRQSAAGIQVREVSGVSVCLLDSFIGQNYFHWLLDWLPRLVLARTAIAHVDNIFTFAKPTSHYEIETLKRLLRSGEGVVHFDDAPGLRFERVIIENGVGEHAHSLFEGHPLVRDKLLADLQIEPTAPHLKRTRLYVPRRHSRRVLNESEIWPVLEKAGFEKVDTDRMSFADQVEMFSRAEAVVAPHGAALTNLLFCQKHAKVLELFPQFGANAAIYVLATAGELDYSCYVDDITNSSYRADLTSSMLVHDASFNVSPSWLQSWISQQL